MSQVDFNAYADYARQAVEGDVKDDRSVEELVHDSSVAQVKYLVESGELKAEEVYEAESKGKKRATLLAEYEPEDSESE